MDLKKKLQDYLNKIQAIYIVNAIPIKIPISFSHK